MSGTRSNKICPVCGTGNCQYRDGIMCRSWVCASGVYKGTSGNKGIDKLNEAYHQSDTAAGVKAGINGYNNIMDILRGFYK